MDNGVFKRDGMLDYLVEKPGQYPGSSGCRNIRDVESDLKAVGADEFQPKYRMTNGWALANCC